MPSFKKIISAFCAAAMVATTTLVPVMAADGDVYNDFDSYDPGVYADVTSGTVKDTPIEGVTLYTGKRDGASNSNVQIEAGAGIDGSNALTIHNGKFSNIDRGSRVGLNTPEGMVNFKATMKVKRDANQKLYYSDSTTTGGVHPTTQIPLPDEEWHDLGIYIRGEERLITVDSKVVVSDKVKTLPILWGAEVDDSSANYVLAIDNLTIGEFTEADSAQLVINTIDLKKYTDYSTDDNGVEATNDIIVPTEDSNVYGVASGTFHVDASKSGIGILWSSNRPDLVDTESAYGTIVVKPSDKDETITLTATADGYPNATRNFTLNLQGVGAFLEYVASIIDLSDADLSNANLTKDDETGDSYTAISSFKVPVTLNGASIEWTGDETVKVNGDTISFVNWDAGTHTITAHVTSGGQEKTRDFKINVPKARVFYNDNYDDWAAGNLVDLATPSNTSHPGYNCTSATRNGTGQHFIAVAAGGPEGSTNYINNVLTQYNDDGSRTHAMEFTKMVGAEISKDLYVKFDFMLNDDTTTMRLTDGSVNVDLSTSNYDIKSGVWYHADIITHEGSASGTITEPDGTVVDNITAGGLSRILRFEGTANYYSFAFDNLYAASGDVPVINPTGTTNITTGKDAVIASLDRINSAEDFSYTLSEGGEDIVDVKLNENNEVVVSGKNEGTVDITLKAETDIAVEKTVKVVVGGDDFFATEAAKAAVSALANGTTSKYNAASQTVTVESGNLDVQTSVNGADIVWTSSDANAVTADGKVYPYDGCPDKVTLKAAPKYNDKDGTAAEVTVDLTAYKASIEKDFTKAAASTEVVPYTDSISKDTVQFNMGDDHYSGDIIYNNLTFPTSATAVDTITVKYDVASDSEQYISDAGVISVSDKNEHPVTITRHLAYIKDNVVLREKDDTYNKIVQFDPADAEVYVAGDESGAGGALYSHPIEMKNKDAYLKAMVYDYAVKFDSKIDSNFGTIPQSTTTDFAVKTGDTVFGSAIEWSTSGSRAIIYQTGGNMRVSRQSADTNVTLSATLSYGTATSEQPRTFTVLVPGTGGGYGGGGGGSYGGGNNYGGASKSGSYGGGPITGSDLIPIDNGQTSKPNPNPSGFNDLDSVPWAVTAINNLYVNGVITGKAPGMFCPNDNVTRAEFAKILIGAFNIPTVSVSEATFFDVPTGHWASSYIETAFQKGIITGYDNGAFDPDAYVTRQDMTVMVQRAMNTMGYSADPKVEAVTFTDDANIASYAKEAVSTLQQAGIVNGVGEGAFEPLSTSTRAQACQMIYNVFNK